MQLADILRELDDHGLEDISSTRKLSIINDVVADVSSRDAWPFLEKQTSITLTVANSGVPTLPADFKSAISLQITSPSYSILRPERLDEISRIYTASSGKPCIYYFVGNALNVYPIPDSTYTATLSYYAWNTTLTAASLETDILLPAAHHRVVVLGALARLFAVTDPGLAASFNNQYEERIQAMKEDLNRKHYDVSDRIFVVDEGDDGPYLY